MSFGHIGFLQGYVELAIICAFTRMLQHLRLPLGQKPEEINGKVISKVELILSLKCVAMNPNVSRCTTRELSRSDVEKLIPASR